MKFITLSKYKILGLALIFIIPIFTILAYKYFTRGVCSNCNLIIISIDALRADHMGVYGYNKGTTPNIDNFANHATVYRNVSTQIPMTYPSFAMLMTGKDLSQTDIYSNRLLTDPNGNSFKLKYTSPNLDSSFKTLAETLKMKSYKTAAFVANAVLSPEISNINRGFDKYEIINKADYKQYEQAMVEAPMKYLLENKNSKNFLWLHFVDPHSPYTPPKDLQCKFNTRYCKQIRNENVWNLEEKRKQIEGCQIPAINKDEVELYKTLYDGEIAYSDALVGKILGVLYENSLDKNTIIVIYSDHGEGFDHDYYFNHPGSVYNSTTKIPLVIYNPKGRDKTITSLLQNSDIYHLLLSFMGIEKKPIQRELVFGSNIDRGALFVTDGHYKYIKFLPHTCNPTGKSSVLYNLLTDPNENTDISALNKEQTEYFQKKLDEYFKNEPLFKSNDAKDNETEINEDTIDQIRKLGY